MAAPANMSWSKVTSMNASGSAAMLSGGGLTATTVGGTTGSSTSTSCDWLIKHPAVGRGEDVEAARAALGHRHLLQRRRRRPSSARWASGPRCPPGVFGRVVVRDEQQVVESRFPADRRRSTGCPNRR